MEGKFLKKKFTGWLLLTLFCGLYCIGNGIFRFIIDPGSVGNALTFLTVGIITESVTLLSWLLNRGAYIHISDDRIKAKYHLFGRLDCRISDVAFALAQVNTLNIQLKDGRTHTVMGIGNPWELASVIRRNMSFEPTEAPEALIKRLDKLKSLRKKRIAYIIFSFGLLILDILVTMILTGERDMYEFSRTDWAVFAVMGLIGIAAVTFAFVIAQKAGKPNIPIERVKYEIQRRIIETEPLLPGNAIKVYADENYIGRITLYGCPGKSDVYYAIEKINSEYKLQHVYTSDEYESQEELSDGFDELIDITEKFMH